ncbi:MAG: hypothetical protein Q8922_02195 [Bacteroidota bacterium]|nr:hypothetical protein [Bacteroidota bacterium]MDP4232315.1 hypothetical protein [Bacteroidota bacterium]MDP4241454.1 hypothetical protein [Bacteroidota bacterium]MDP4286722.1 hypothetical protein [Bacteroidota bacterium]
MKASIIALLLVVGIGGCKSSVAVNTDELGTLRGKVVALGVNCDSISDRSGVTVLIEGTNFSASTDVTGQWVIEHVPAGVYNVIVTKPSFDTDLTAEYQIIGAGTQFLEHAMIQAIPLDSIPIVSLSAVKRTYDSVGGKFYITVTLTMMGRDSIVSGMTHLQNLKDSLIINGIVQRPVFSILRNGTYTYVDSSESFWEGMGPHSGDTVRITSIAQGGIPPNPCGQYSPYRSTRTIVLP